MSETSQVSGATDDITSMASEGQAMTFSATFVVKVGVCQTFQEDECNRKCENTLKEQLSITNQLVRSWIT